MKLRWMGAALAVGLLVPVAAEAQNLTPEILFGGRWEGTAAEVAPRIALDENGVNLDYDDPRLKFNTFPLYLQFLPSTDFDFDVRLAYSPEGLDTSGTRYRQVSGQIEGNTVRWSNIQLLLVDFQTGETAETGRFDYSVTFSEDALAGLWHLDGRQNPAFLVDEIPDKSWFTRQILTPQEIHVSRSLDVAPVPVPLPPAAWAGITMLGAMALNTWRRQRRQAAVEVQ